MDLKGLLQNLNEQWELLDEEKIIAFSNFMQAGLNQLFQQSINLNAIAGNVENLSKLSEKLY